MQRLDQHKKLFLPLLLLMMLLTGILVFRDYGISWDENTQRNSGIVFFDHIQKALGIELVALPGNIPELENYGDKEFGADFEILLFAMERMFGMDDYREVFFLRHLINFLFFWMGVAVFGLTIRERFRKWYLPVMAILILFLHPRIFAQSFYNSKDIIVMVFFIFSFYAFIRFGKTGKLRYALLLALFSAITFNIRPVGILIPFLAFLILLFAHFSSSNLRDGRKKNGWYLAVMPVMFLFFVWMTNPYLWNAPLTKMYAIVIKFLNYDTTHTAGNLLFLGKYIPTNQVPWYYLPVWIGVSTPVIWLVLFFMGFVFFTGNVFRKKYFSSFQPETGQDIFVAGWLLFPVLVAVIFHSTLYDGWRHFYFLWPAMVYFMIYGLDKISGFIMNKTGMHDRIVRISAFAIIIFAIMANVYVLVRHHPHQYCYFNAVAPRPAENFVPDYWGLSYRDALEKLVETGKPDSITVRALNLPGYLNSFMLKPDHRKRIWYDTYIRENYGTRMDSYFPFAVKPGELPPGKTAGYYLSNFRDTGSPEELYKYRNHLFPYSSPVFSIKYGKTEILGVYRISW